MSSACGLEFPQAGKADLSALVIEEDPNCGQM